MSFLRNIVYIQRFLHIHMTSGLYFPYVSYDSLRTLNCAMLLFDEIYEKNPFDISNRFGK